MGVTWGSHSEREKGGRDKSLIVINKHLWVLKGRLRRRFSHRPPNLFVSLNEVSQTGGTCPIENPNMGTQHGKAIMSSSCRAGRREKMVEVWGRRGQERYENTTCLRIARAKTIRSSGSPRPPLFSPASSPASTGPSPRIMLRAPRSSHDSLDV